MSPPANTPGEPVISEVDTTTVSSAVNSTPGTARRNPVSVRWPSARITVSAASVSNRPVPRGRPPGSSSITSTVSAGPSNAVMVRNQLMRTPSRSASCASSSCAGICARVRRYTMRASSAPSRRATRAASIAVLPPP